jgi:hypothetical protein
VTAGLFLAVLTASAIVDVNVGIRGEKAIFWNLVDKHELMVLVAFPVALWLALAFVFYRFSRDSADPVTRAVSWLFRGSVLELLIAIPAHVMVRRRNECSAPVVTSFGIASGITIMLLSFGPSVLLLYKKRIESLQARRAAAAK